MATTRKIHRKHIGGIAKRDGIRHQTSAAPEGNNQHWKYDAHEEDGLRMSAGGSNDDNYVKELQKSMNMLSSSGGLTMAWADASNEELDLEGVREARMLEVQFCKDMGVYTRREGGKLIDVKWTDVNKGGQSNPQYRPRHVGRGVNDQTDDSLNTATPPLEAMRLVLRNAATAAECNRCRSTGCDGQRHQSCRLSCAGHVCVVPSTTP